MTKHNATLKMTIVATSIKQSANEVLDTKEKNLHYLIIKNKKGEKLVLNVGEKTVNKINELLKNDK